MSVHRRLIENQLAITPSMEAAQLERNLDELCSQFKILTGVHAEMASGTLSLESSSLLEALGYSTEAEEKKSLLSRIWEGIKKIFGKIREFIARLISVRSHRLAGNDFKMDKLKKYIHNLDMTAKPEGKFSSNPTLLPAEPGKMIEGCHKVRAQARTVMEFRKKSIDAVTHVDPKAFGTGAAQKVIDGLQSTSGSEVTPGAAGVAAFINSKEGKLDYRIVLKDHASVMVEGASVVLMGSLIKEHESITEEDKKFLDEIKSSEDHMAGLIKKFDELSDKAWKDHMTKDATTFEEHDRDNAAYDKLSKELRAFSEFITQVRRLSHSKVYDVLYGDLEDALRSSLGQYKFKKHEIQDGDHEFR